MAEEKIMIATRNPKGQIGYLSEGLTVPEFIELLRPKNQTQVLVDYSPVIEELHRLHKMKGREDIIKKYNTIFDYWQETKSYTIESVKTTKSEELIKQAISLIHDLQAEFLKANKELISKNYGRMSLDWHNTYNPRWREEHDLLKSIKNHADIYIDVLLCFIHAKASLDIGSFKKDVVLCGYVDFLNEFIIHIYRSLLRVGTVEDSFLKFIAFKQSEKLQDYLKLDGQDKTLDQYRLSVLAASLPALTHNEQMHPCLQVSICFDNFPDAFVQIVEAFRDLLHKIFSVDAFLEKLKNGDYLWDDSSELVEELREQITCSSNVVR